MDMVGITVAVLSTRSAEITNEEDEIVVIFSSRLILGLADTKARSGALQKGPLTWEVESTAARFDLALLLRGIGTFKHSRVGNE